MKNNPEKNLTPHLPEEILKKIRVAVCGELSTACNYLLKNGVVSIDKFSDAAEIADESDYHLILIYAPQAEGLLNTSYCRNSGNDCGGIPIRLLNEPACDSALIELKSTIRRIGKEILAIAQ